MKYKKINTSFVSIPELAKQLGISRVAALKKVRSGSIVGEKVGRNYIITRKEAERALGISIGAEERNRVTKSVKKVVKTYRQALEMLKGE